MVDSEKIIKERCSDEGEFWYSKGSLKKYARYELGVEVNYKKWDESGNVKE
ncbi:MAG: hypothetical protein AB2417_12485 [Clostridiaceae bacterium]